MPPLTTLKQNIGLEPWSRSLVFTANVSRSLLVYLQVIGPERFTANKRRYQLWNRLATIVLVD